MECLGVEVGALDGLINIRDQIGKRSELLGHGVEDKLGWLEFGTVGNKSTIPRDRKGSTRVSAVAGGGRGWRDGAGSSGARVGRGSLRSLQRLNNGAKRGLTGRGSLKVL